MSEVEKEVINEQEKVVNEPAKEEAEVKTEKKKTERNSKSKKEIEKLRADLKEADEKCEEYKNDYLRARADYENLKRRTETSNSQFFTEGTAKAVLEFLPVIDNLERAIDAEKEQTSMKQGVEMVLRQAKTALEKLGVKEIPAEGEKFDPNLHNAVMQVEKEDGEESGVIKVVLMKGYVMNDRVIRHSMVQVTE